MPVDPIFYKAGFSSPEDPYDFTMSSEAPDSYGDIVVQDWDLKQFKKNPIALWMHSARDPIGVWENVSVADGKLQGRLKPARRGSSPTVDTVLNLLEQGVLRAVSVGFRSDKPEPLDEKDPWGGYRLAGNKLLECSVVTIPANDEALRKYLRTVDPVIRDALAPKSGVRNCASGACVQLARAKSQASDPTATFTPKSMRNATMSLADKIKAKQQEILQHRDAIAGITNGVDETGSLNQDQMDLIDELTSKLEAAQGHLKSLEKLERSVAESVGSISQRPAEQGAPRIEIRDNKPKGHKAFAAVSCIVRGYGLRQDPIEVAKQEYRDQAEIEHLVRSATAPATTAGSTWATNLMEQSWGEMVDLLRDVSIYPRVPGLRVNFNNTLNLPVQNGRGALAAGFVAENGAIPVKEGSIGTTSLAPKKLGVISAFTKELARRSMPSIQTVVQSQILADTAEGLDTLFLDATARSTTRPAGLRDTTETGAGNINAVTNTATGAGNATAKEVLSTVAALLARVWAIKGSDGVWLMNPAQRLGLENKQDGTTGHFVFRDEVQRGRFGGFPIIESTNVTAGIVAFIANNAMGFGSELAPYFEQSDQATLHFETSAATLSAVATPNTVAAPVISLFQQDLFAIKSIWTLDWRILRQAGVQILTGADGW